MTMIFKFFLIIFLIVLGYFFIGKAPQADNIIWGVNFSQKHSQGMGLDWKDNYLSLFEDLKVKHLKLITHWDLLEPEQGNYRFNDLDWQIKKAEDNNVKLILVIGMKTGRWPECHIPEWAKNLSKEEQQEKVLKLIEETILRYKNSASINAWQVENEPLFSFGECPWIDKGFLQEEIKKVKSLDSENRIVIISDSGEASPWLEVAKLGDVIGITMYRKVWMSQINRYVDYYFPPVFYWRKAEIINKLFGKQVICAELQAEPWGPKLLYDSPIEEQNKTMNLEKFKDNIDFAKKTGLSEFYLWGSEWWYWLKVKQGNSEIWDQAKSLF